MSERAGRGSTPRTTRFLRLIAGPSPLERRLLVQEARNWEMGGEGEERLAETLQRRCPDTVFLHDRRMPLSRANIDHIALAPSGVYVIDAKRHRGAVRVSSSLVAGPQLRIDGRDRSLPVARLQRQVEVVHVGVAALGEDVPVHGCLCFLARPGALSGSGLPALRTLRIEGFALYSPARLVGRLRSRGPLTAERAMMLREELAALLPSAAGEPR